MKLKKIISGAAGAGLVLTMSGTALAYSHYHGSQDSLSINNDADVSANVYQTAMSGGNTINGDSGLITTGESSNYLRLKQDVNYNDIGNTSDTNSESLMYGSHHSNGKDTNIDNEADVKATVHQDATSGDNEINQQNQESYSLFGHWKWNHNHGGNNQGTAEIRTGLSRNEASIDQFVNTVIMPN